VKVEELTLHAALLGGGGAGEEPADHHRGDEGEARAHHCQHLVHRASEAVVRRPT
jgi:hypothetical protein